MMIREYGIQNKITKRLVFVTASRSIALLRFKMYDKEYFRLVVVRRERTK